MKDGPYLELVPHNQHFQINQHFQMYQHPLHPSWQATLMSTCIGRGMDGQLGSVLIQLLVISQPSTPCRLITNLHDFNLLLYLQPRGSYSILSCLQFQTFIHTDHLFYTACFYTHSSYVLIPHLYTCFEVHAAAKVNGRGLAQRRRGRGTT